MITIDELFAEDFEPAWMVRNRFMVKLGLEQAITADTNYKFEMAARKSRESIASRCDSKGNYTNGSFTARAQNYK